jgi:mannosyltransferase OCH1-like enzyme
MKKFSWIIFALKIYRASATKTSFSIEVKQVDFDFDSFRKFYRLLPMCRQSLKNTYLNNKIRRQWIKIRYFDTYLNIFDKKNPIPNLIRQTSSHALIPIKIKIQFQRFRRFQRFHSSFWRREKLSLQLTNCYFTVLSSFCCKWKVWVEKKTILRN